MKARFSQLDESKADLIIQQLRKEKDQLRKEKDQLRKEKDQLQQLVNKYHESKEASIKLDDPKIKKVGNNLHSV